MEWTIPEGIPSGVYIMRLTNENGDKESLPLFICPPLDEKIGEEKKKKKKKKKV